MHPIAPGGRPHTMNQAEIPSPPQAPVSGRRRWIQHLPYLSLALFLAAIAALVWLPRTYAAAAPPSPARQPAAMLSRLPATKSRP